MSEYRLKPLPHQRPRNETLRTPLSEKQTKAILRIIPKGADSEVMLRELELAFMRYRTGKWNLDNPETYNAIVSSMRTIKRYIRKLNKVLDEAEAPARRWFYRGLVKDESGLNEQRESLGRERKKAVEDAVEFALAKVGAGKSGEKQDDVWLLDAVLTIWSAGTGQPLSMVKETKWPWMEFTVTVLKVCGFEDVIVEGNLARRKKRNDSATSKQLDSIVRERVKSKAGQLTRAKRTSDDSDRSDDG